MIPEIASQAANKVVDKLDTKNINLYITLAKYGLWVTCVTLVAVIIGGAHHTLGGDPARIGNVVSACQVLSMICVTVLGFHGYAGSRLFYELRNWNQPKKPLIDPVVK